MFRKIFDALNCYISNGTLYLVHLFEGMVIKFNR